MFSTPHFVTGDFKTPGRFLPDDEYGRALDCLVKACTDIMIVNPQGEVLLGKRKVYPQPDWWIIGGRMRPGETVSLSIQRLLSRELHFTLSDLSRVRTIAHYSYCFDTRNEEPKENGNADLVAILSLNIDHKEAASLTKRGVKDPLDNWRYFDTEEYSSICWVKPEDILIDSFALKRASRDLLAMRVWDEMESVHSGSKEGDLKALLSSFMLLKSNKPLQM